MIEYAKFLSKRVLYRKSNIIIGCIIILIILVFLVMNIRTQDQFESNLYSQMEVDKQSIETYKKKLTKLDKNSQEYKIIEATVQLEEKNSETFEIILANFRNKEWNKVYESYSEILEERIQIMKDSENISDVSSTSSRDMINVSMEELNYFKYLMDHNLDYENPNFPIFGLSFTTSVAQFLLPIIITVYCIYILSQIFTIEYAKNIDISYLYPIMKNKIIGTKILVGMSASVIIYIGILFSSFLLSYLLTLNTGFDYPIIMRNNENEFWNVLSTLSFSKEWFFIGILFYTNLSLFTYISSLFIKEDVYLFLILLFIVLGFSYLPNILDSLKVIAHFLPTTYMNFVSVASGDVAVQYLNTHISSMTGVFILSSFIGIQCLFIAVYKYAYKLTLHT